MVNVMWWFDSIRYYKCLFGIIGMDYRGMVPVHRCSVMFSNTAGELGGVRLVCTQATVADISLGLRFSPRVKFILVFFQEQTI